MKTKTTVSKMSITPSWSVVIADRTGLHYTAQATVETVIQGGRLPYHVIFSRGMMQQWIQHGWATTQEELGPEARWWHTIAPLLEDAWNFWANRPEVRGPDGRINSELIQKRLQHTARQLFDYLVSCHAPLPHLKPYTSIPPPVSAGMIRAALDAGVRSFDQGLAAALDHLARNKGKALIEYCCCTNGYRPSIAAIRQVELTSLKEGHTSSVVRVVVQFHEMEARVLFGLNVARDLSDAADELEVNQRDLVEWAALDPDGVAEVYGAGEGRILWFGREARLPIVAVKWLEGFHELHVVRNPQNPAGGICVLVNEFRQTSRSLPEIIGSQLEESTSDRFWATIVAQRTCLANIDWQSGIVVTPDLELNHGDVVVELQGNDVRLAFVASSARRLHIPSGVWPFLMALSSARDDRSPASKRLYWGKPKQALNAVCEGIIQRLPNDRETAYKLATRMLKSALCIDMDRLTSYMSLSPDDAVGWRLLLETRREVLRLLSFIT